MKAYEGYKQCSKCKCVYPISFFYKNKRNVDGLQYMCITCNNEYRNNWINRNGERYKKQREEYRRIHKKRRNEYNRKKRIEYKENLICTVCGKNPIAFYRSFTKCERCLEKHNRKNNKRRNELVINGLCTWCGKQLIAYGRSSCICDYCLDRAIYLWKYRNGYYPHLEEELLKVKKYMEEKRNEGSRI